MIPTRTAPAPAPTTPAPPAPARAVTLHAQLDPSFVQSPTNPLAVTYFYSASATVGSENEPNLPGGILNLYSDGLLACSINVGGSITGGECLVTYQAAGPQTVVVTYSSDSVSVTETYTENIEKPEPPPLVYHTLLQHSLIECREEEEKQSGEKYRWCTYGISATTVDQYDVEAPERIIWFVFLHEGQFANQAEAEASHTYELKVAEDVNARKCWISLPELNYVTSVQSNYCSPRLRAYNEATLTGSESVQLEA